MNPEATKPNHRKWLAIGIILGLLSALSGWWGVQGWSGQAGGRPIPGLLGAPFLFVALTTRSWILGVAGSVLVWTGGTYLSRFLWGRLPKAWTQHVRRVRDGLRKRMKWVAGGSVMAAMAIGLGIFLVMGNRGVAILSDMTAAASVAVSKGHIYVGVGDLRVYRVAEDGNGLEMLSSTGLPEVAVQTAVSGHMVYTISHSGLQAVDASDPSAPVLSGSMEWEIPGGHWISLAVSGDMLLASNARGSQTNENVMTGLSLIDVSDPSDPREVGALPIPPGSDGIGDVALTGSLAFVAARLSGLFIYDIWEPSDPVLLSHYEPLSWSRGVAVEGDHVYLSVSMRKGSSRIHVLDVSEPSEPALVTTIKTSGPSQKVSAGGGRLYVADHMSGLKIHDVTEPSKPRFAGRFRTNGMFGSCCNMANSVSAADGLIAVLASPRMFILREKS